MESKYVQEEGPIHILSQDTANKKKHPKNNIIAIIIEDNASIALVNEACSLVSTNTTVMHTHKKRI